MSTRAIRTRTSRRHALLLLVLPAALLGALFVLLSFVPSASPHAEACAFLRTPQAYEADSRRAAYFLAMDAAASDALFAGDPIFGMPAVEVGPRNVRQPGPRTVPVSILKSIGWIESNLAMAAQSVPFQSLGPALISFDCGHGIMQITTGMTVPLGPNNQATAAQSNIATHYAYNIARGAVMLGDKWNEAPEFRPVAGTDTNSNPTIIENWYFAVWAYNGFTGPGANISNHPLDPQFTMRAGWRCDGSQSRTRYPYQELVWGCMANPPSANGARLWAPVPASLPDLSRPEFFNPLSVANFVFPYRNMDIPTPQPAHAEPPPTLPADYRARLLGAPQPAVSQASVQLRLDSGPSASRATVQVRNSGTGILIWNAVPSANWIVVDPPAGVSLGTDIPCTAGACGQVQGVTISVNPVLLPSAMASGSVTISSTNAGGGTVTVPVTVTADFDTGASGTSRAY